MATARVTIGTIFETVSTAATVATGALNSIAGGVAMANAFVAKAQVEQRDTYLIESKVFRKRLIEDAAREQVETDMKIAEFCERSVGHQQSYDRSYLEFAALFDKPKDESTVRGFRSAAE